MAHCRRPHLHSLKIHLFSFLGILSDRDRYISLREFDKKNQKWEKPSFAGACIIVGMYKNYCLTSPYVEHLFSVGEATLPFFFPCI